MSADVKKLIVASTRQQYRVWLKDKNPREHLFVYNHAQLRGWSRDMPVLLVYPDLSYGNGFSELCHLARQRFDTVKVTYT